MKRVAGNALKFVVLLGLVSLLADMTYEGARGIAGPFLGTLGATGAVVGLVAGLGEFVGYALRLVSGYLSDRTRRYWLITGIGYCLNLLAVPALALAGNWQVAAVLMVLERVGKAMRTPARDTMLSYATSQLGHGWGFALHEAMDQIGAILGPLLAAASLTHWGKYNLAFLILLVPALMALAVLATARVIYPNPRELETKAAAVVSKEFPREFWVYLLAVSLVAAGYADFPLIAFHLKQGIVIPDAAIPLAYALAMGVDAVAALAFGRMYDRIKVRALVAAVGMSAWFAPFAFLASGHYAIIGIVLWGIGMGAQESILRAAIAGLVSPERRGSAYGMFNAAYGLAWFMGSAFMGVLYDVSVASMVAFSVAAQLASVALLTRVGGTHHDGKSDRP
ncbi:MAG: MFS transporter [Bacillota bacterium]